MNDGSVGLWRPWAAAALLGVALMIGAAAAGEERRALDGFDRVLFAIPGRLTLVQGDDHEVVIEALEEDLQRIETRVEGDELAIRWRNGVLGMFGGRPEGSIDVRVTLPALEALEVAGSGDVDAGSWLSERFLLEVNGSGNARFAELATEELIVEVSGSGNVEIPQLDSADVRVEINGSGDVELAGAADRQDLRIMGSGDVDAEDLEGARVAARIMGSGDVSVWATERLDAEIMGSGDIRYRGSPEVNRSEHGSGRVRPM